MEQTTLEPKSESKSLIALGSRGLQLTTFDELYRFSEFVIKAGLAPRSVDTKEKVFLALQYAMEMGLTPMVGLQNCMVVNNRVSFYGELVVGQMQGHQDFEDFTTEYSGEGQSLTCTVTVKRRGMSPSVGTFSIAEAKHLIDDNSKSGTWGKYPRRMLFWRAFSRAKVIFSDVLKGVKMPSDLEDEGFETAKPAKAVEVKRPEFKGADIPKEPRPEPEHIETDLPQAVRDMLAQNRTPESAFLQVLVNNKHIEAGVPLDHVPAKILSQAISDWEEVEAQMADVLEGGK